MADRKIARPVKAALVEGKWFIVDADDRKLDFHRYGSEAAARANAKRINDSWERAKEERKRMAEATDGEEWAGARARAEWFEHVAEAHSRMVLSTEFDPRRHPRDRLGKFVEVLGLLKTAPKGSELSLRYGVTIKRAPLGGYAVQRRGYTVGYARRPKKVLDLARFSAEQYLKELDDREGKKYRGRALDLAAFKREVEALGAF